MSEKPRSYCLGAPSFKLLAVGKRKDPQGTKYSAPGLRIHDLRFKTLFSGVL